jgi:hypothetical protein
MLVLTALAAATVGTAALAAAPSASAAYPSPIGGKCIELHLSNGQYIYLC